MWEALLDVRMGNKEDTGGCVYIVANFVWHIVYSIKFEIDF